MAINFKQGDVTIPINEDNLIDYLEGNGESVIPYNIKYNNEIVWTITLFPLTLSYSETTGVLSWNDVRIKGHPSIVRYKIWKESPTNIISTGENIISFNLKNAGITEGVVGVSAEADYGITPIEASIRLEKPGPTPPPAGTTAVIVCYQYETRADGYYRVYAYIQDYFGDMNAQNTTLMVDGDATAVTPAGAEVLFEGTDNTNGKNAIIYTTYNYELINMENIALKKKIDNNSYCELYQVAGPSPQPGATNKIVLSYYANTSAAGDYEVMVDVDHVEGNLSSSWVQLAPGGTANITYQDNSHIEWGGSFGNKKSLTAHVYVFYDDSWVGEYALEIFPKTETKHFLKEFIVEGY